MSNVVKKRLRNNLRAPSKYSVAKIMKPNSIEKVQWVQTLAKDVLISI